MSIHSPKHSLITFFLLLLQIFSPITKSLAGNPHVINFRSQNLFPESLAWDPKSQHFLTGSLNHRTISSISDAGIVETIISDTSLPENVTVLGITVDSLDNRVLAVIHAVKPLSPFNALAAYDLKSGNRLFLSLLPSDDQPALANDVAVDFKGNAYVTNSIGNFIWKVNNKGEASIFSKSERFTEHTVDPNTPYSFCGLNGIAYVSNGYLLVAQSNTGKMFKVDVHDGTARHVLLNKDLTCPDGVVLRRDGVVLVVSPEAKKLWLLKSDNGWGEGVVYDQIDLGDEGYPTSVVARERDKMYVLYGYFMEGVLGNSERESFRIEEIRSPKESEDENIWIYVMVGFGLVYFLYWRFQMGQLVKNMDKKIN